MALGAGLAPGTLEGAGAGLTVILVLHSCPLPAETANTENHLRTRLRAPEVVPTAAVTCSYPETPSPLAAGVCGGAQTAGCWETLGTPGSQVRVHCAYVTTWSCWLRRPGRCWAQVTGLIYGHHFPFSSVPRGTLTADNARAAERESGVTSVPFSGGRVHRTDLCISKSHWLTSPVAASRSSPYSVLTRRHLFPAKTGKENP